MDWDSFVSSQNSGLSPVNIFNNLGWSPVQSAGIVGNLQHESASPNLNPLAIGDSGQAFGIAQWHPDRIKGLLDFAKQYNLNPSARDTQILYVDHELRNSEASAGNKLSQATTPQEATAAMVGFERPRGYTPAHPENSAGFSSRLANAQALMQPMTVGSAPSWDDFVKQQEQPAMDMSRDPTEAPTAPQKEFGITDTWPFRLGKTIYNAASDAATLPGDVYSGKQSVEDPSITGRALNFASLATPGVSAEAVLTPKTAKAPTEKELFASGAKARDLVKNANVALSAPMVAQWAKWMEPNLLREGFSDASSNSPTTYALLRNLAQGAEGGKFTAGNYIDLRRALQNTARNYGAGPDQAAASYTIKALDNLFHKVDPSSFVAGTPAEVGRVRMLLKNANADFAAGYRSQDVTNPQYAAELRAAAVNSGKNLDNATRQRLAGLLIKENRNPGITALSQPELAKTESVVKGTAPRNLARFAGNLLGGGGGLGQAAVGLASGITTGVATGQPLLGVVAGAGPAIVGSALKGLENLLTKREVNALSNMIRLRSALGAERSAAAIKKALPKLSPAAQAAYRSLVAPVIQGQALDEQIQNNPNQL